MPQFEYIAIDSNGKNTKGTIDAENSRSARQKLRTKGIYPTSINESSVKNDKSSRDVKKYFQSGKVGQKDLAVITRQLATLLAAGLPLVNALHALVDQTDSTVLRQILVDVREKVEEGLSLAKALAKYPKSFPRLYVNLVASGEASGSLDVVLDNLAEYLDTQIELQRKIRGALTYPILMLSICVFVIVALFVFVIPKIVEIFEKQGASLPLPTQIMIAISNFLVGYWYLIILTIIGIVYGARWYYKQPNGKEKIDYWLLHLPVFSPVYIKIATARVSKTLGALLSSGVGLLICLDITKNIISNVHIVRVLENTKDGVEKGKNLSRELTKDGIFPSLLGHMIAVGEKSGELENMLNKVGDAYEKEVNATLSNLTSILEPLMMVFVGVIVFCIVISVLLPMTDLINVIQG